MSANLGGVPVLASPVHVIVAGRGRHCEGGRHPSEHKAYTRPKSPQRPDEFRGREPCLTSATPAAAPQTGAEKSCQSAEGVTPCTSSSGSSGSKASGSSSSISAGSSAS